IEQTKSNNTQQIASDAIASAPSGTPTTTSTSSVSPRQRHHKNQTGKHVLVSSSSKH
ncbi:unnamed protein product, partial [Rotaria magnacalcarata]